MNVGETSKYAGNYVNAPSFHHHYVTNKEMRQCGVNNADADLREREAKGKSGIAEQMAAAAAAAVHSLTR